MWSKYYPSWENWWWSSAGDKAQSAHRAKSSSESEHGTLECTDSYLREFSPSLSSELPERPGKWSDTTPKRYAPRSPGRENIHASCPQHTGLWKASWLQLRGLTLRFPVWEGLVLDWTQGSVWSPLRNIHSFRYHTDINFVITQNFSFMLIERALRAM